MPRRVIATRAASRDLQDAKEWLCQPGAGDHARQRLKRIRDAIRNLRSQPCLWSFGEHPGIRETPIEGYRILYQLDPETGDNATAGDAVILRVFGPGMNRSA